MDNIPQSDEKQLREFGLILGAILSGLWGLLLPWLHNYSLPYWPWIISAILCCLALFAPNRLQLVYLIWMKIGSILGWINTRLILGIVFYSLIMPTGLVKRQVFHQDPLFREMNADQETYRVFSTVKPKESLEKPF
ncbi:MAG: sxtJ [Moorea sp. SIO2I5]|nr:sxtJ [Moorena sp. SIO2I5]